ncbi:MAG: 3'-5' exonuclease family protein [Sulfuricella sp.]
MILFPDTEFTGLGQRWPRLISIGLVSEDGQHSFYAELDAVGYMEKCDSWVRENILLLLEGGDRTMQPDELRWRLAEWIGALGAVQMQIATDSQTYDFKFLRSILDPWPQSIDDLPVILLYDAEQGERFNLAVESAYAAGLRQHHALDDAKANRLGWIAANGDQTSAER